MRRDLIHGARLIADQQEHRSASRLRECGEGSFGAHRRSLTTFDLYKSLLVTHAGLLIARP